MLWKELSTLYLCIIILQEIPSALKLHLNNTMCLRVSFSYNTTLCCRMGGKWDEPVFIDSSEIASKYVGKAQLFRSCRLLKFSNMFASLLVCFPQVIQLSKQNCLRNAGWVLLQKPQRVLHSPLLARTCVFATCELNQVLDKSLQHIHCHSSAIFHSRGR